MLFQGVSPTKRFRVYVGMLNITGDLYRFYKADMERLHNPAIASYGTFAKVFKTR